MRNLFSAHPVAELGTLDDKELMVKIQQDSDHHAFEVIYMRYRKDVMSYVSYLIFDKNKVEEITHDVFIKAFRFKNKYDHSFKFKTWLYTLARNTSIDIMRKNQDLRFDDLFGDAERDISDVEDPQEGPEDQVINKSESELVMQAMEKIPADQREVLSLMALSELSYKEIHEITGKSVANIKVLVHRGKKALAEQLKKMGEEV